jgi:hypothetical protein
MAEHDRWLKRRCPAPARVALLVVALTLATTGCLGSGPGGGLRNGFLPDSVLTPVNANCKIWTPAAPSLIEMIALARSQGVQLTPESCYRSYADQVSLRNWWCYFGLCQFAAVPGTSTHGWGKAVDFRDQNGELTFSSVGYQWLSNAARLYCFFHPAWAEPNAVAPEPWHWEWTC